MTTLVLQTVGSAVGSYFGGPLGEIVGRGLGALAGSAVDSALLGGGSRIVEGPRLREMAGLGAGEGAPVPRLFGRARLGGQLIWATRFEEEVVSSVRSAGGGKSLSSQRVRQTDYVYHANLAIALCEGPISFVRRVWADGRELDLSRLTMRVHRGAPDQLPDALIVAKEGPDRAPAYRGTAYVVFEKLPLADHGNRIPQFSFEVVRALPGPADSIRSVNLIPGSSEFAYDVATVTRLLGPGLARSENRHQLQAESDVIASLDQLQALCPALTGVSIIVTWFGDDLRASACTLAPRVDNAVKQTDGATWTVAGLGRPAARLVSQVDGVSAYGGTPSDASVLALIAELKRRGLAVTLYPFIMMDIAPGSTLPAPAGGMQPAYPWRGRIGVHPAGEAAPQVSADVASFVGTVRPADFSLAGASVQCARPDEWSYRRHNLHYAMLAMAAGGVDGFVIGSELVGLTRARAASGVYPFVAALQALAADVRQVLGPGCRLTYAADWTEYGAHILSGGQEIRFPLDPLWASPHIDAVGIDYYPPVTDWREGVDHLDAGTWRSPHDVAYLAARQRSGEGFDWFYSDDAARRAQIRSPIEDGAGKPWIHRVKDLAAWWSQPHRERVGGIELTSDTPWQASGKPIWLTEIGCPAVDLGANAPHVFPDPKSSEGSRPPFSSGARDDLMQLRALEAQIGVFDPQSPLFEEAANPAGLGSARMLSPEDITVWAWDARPFPAFPMLRQIWSDGPNWQAGHWLNGRLEAAPLDRLVPAILSAYGLPPAARLDIDHLVDGYVIERPMSAREALEPLAKLFGLDARFREGRLVITGDAPRPVATLDPATFVPMPDGAPFALRRAQESELPAEIRLDFIDGEWEYRRAAVRSRRLGGAARREVGFEASIVTGRVEASRLAALRLREAWASRETIGFGLGPVWLGLEPGDRVALGLDGKRRLFRITEIDDGDTRRVKAVSAEPAPLVLQSQPELATHTVPAPSTALRPIAVALELPLARGSGGATPLLFLAAAATPWPGPLTALRAQPGAGYAVAANLGRAALTGRILQTLPAALPWRLHRLASVEVEMDSGGLQSVSEAAMLAGLNRFAVLGPDGLWEVLGAAEAALIGPRRYRLSGFVRGLGGSEALAGREAPAGSLIVAIDEALAPLTDDLADLGRTLTFRVVPPGADAADPSASSVEAAVRGLALRPLAPVHARARRAILGIEIGWIRRSRVDADSWDLADAPLGEAAEAYRVTIRRAGSVVRSMTVSGPFVIYPSADELVDFGAEQAAIDIEIAQLSEAVGAGEPCRRLLAVS